MNLQELKASFLGLINDRFDLFEFEQQIVVDTPFNFSDGDRLTLFVAPFSRSFKVTDGGSTALKLHLLGINMKTGAVRETWDSMTADIAQRNMAPDGDEIAVVVQQDEIAQALIDVSSKCIHAEHAQLKASASRRVHFTERVDNRIDQFIADAHRYAIWEKRKEVPLESGRKRQITGLFRRDEYDEEPLLIQAVGGRTKQDRNEPADRAFTIFSNVSAPKDEKLVVAIGERESWDAGIIRELDDVAMTVFFEDPTWLENTLNRHLSKKSFA